MLSAARNLKVISRNGTGVDNIDLATAKQREIRICRAEGANARGVAELAIGLMLALARGIPASDRAIKAGRTLSGWVEVTEGLRAGEQVATKGSLFIDRAVRGD